MKNYWFKRKRYGWGWTPITWQGWLSLLVFIGAIFFTVTKVQQNNTSDAVGWEGLISVIILTILFIALCYAKGEKPKWQWGNEDKK